MYGHELDKATALVRNARSSSRDIAQALHRELAAAHTLTDPDLTLEANQRRRGETAQNARDLAGRALSVIRSDHAALRRDLAQAVIPMLDIADDPSSLIRAEQRWNQVKQRIEAGEQLPSILRTADSVTAKAIAEHAPSYLIAQVPRGLTIDDALGRALTGADDTRFEEIRGHVRTQVLDRLAEVNTDATRRAILATAAASEPALEAAEPWLGAIESMVNGHQVNMLDVAIQDAALTGRAQRPSDGDADGADAASQAA